MLRRASLLEIALLAVAAVLPATLTSAPAVSAPSPSTNYANQAFKATNDHRATHGVKRLEKSACLQRFAAAQAQQMAGQRRISHQDLGPILEQCGLGLVGENVAEGYRSGRAAAQGWMRSPGHRANILNPDYNLVAVAARKGGDDRWYSAQVFGRPL
jgi:uncharacterized protein YkwD